MGGKQFEPDRLPCFSLGDRRRKVFLQRRAESRAGVSASQEPIGDRAGQVRGDRGSQRQEELVDRIGPRTLLQQARQTSSLVGRERRPEQPLQKDRYKRGICDRIGRSDTPLPPRGAEAQVDLRRQLRRLKRRRGKRVRGGRRTAIRRCSRVMSQRGNLAARSRGRPRRPGLGDRWRCLDGPAPPGSPQLAERGRHTRWPTPPIPTRSRRPLPLPTPANANRLRRESRSAATSHAKGGGQSASADARPPPAPPRTTRGFDREGHSWESFLWTQSRRRFLVRCIRFFAPCSLMRSRSAISVRESLSRYRCSNAARARRLSRATQARSARQIILTIVPDPLGPDRFKRREIRDCDDSRMTPLVRNEKGISDPSEVRGSRGTVINADRLAKYSQKGLLGQILGQRGLTTQSAKKSPDSSLKLLKQSRRVGIGRLRFRREHFRPPRTGTLQIRYRQLSKHSTSLPEPSGQHRGNVADCSRGRKFSRKMLFSSIGLQLYPPKWWIDSKQMNHFAELRNDAVSKRSRAGAHSSQ